MKRRLIYLDHAAATPMDERVAKAMQPYFSELFYNPSAQYLPAREVKRELEAARGRIAHWLGARPAEVVLTSGGTEANNLAVHGVMRQYPTANVVISAIEHEAVLQPAGNYSLKQAPVTPEGRVDAGKLPELIDDQTVLVSIMYANNEIGTIQPLRQISELVAGIRRQRRAEGNDMPLLLHTDACQAAAYLDIHAARLGVDVMTINAGKIYGPKQCGALYVKGGTRLVPLLEGGGQERGLRSGTENVPGVIGFAEALDIAQAGRHEETRRLQALQQQFFDQISGAIPAARINGSRKHRLPNNVHLTFPGNDNERLIMLLEERGVLAAAGSACSASSQEPSHVLGAIGLSDEEARASLRFTMGRGTAPEDVTAVVAALAEIIV